jgi:hypothetical protein
MAEMMSIFKQAKATSEKLNGCTNYCQVGATAGLSVGDFSVPVPGPSERHFAGRLCAVRPRRAGWDRGVPCMGRGGEGGTFVHGAMRVGGACTRAGRGSVLMCGGPADQPARARRPEQGQPESLLLQALCRRYRSILSIRLACISVGLATTS